MGIQAYCWFKTLLFVWNSHPAPCRVREFSLYITGKILYILQKKRLNPSSFPIFSRKGSSARLRLHLPDSAVFSSELLSSSGEAIPAQLCHPSVLAFIVLILQRALVSAPWPRLRSTQRGYFGRCIPERLRAHGRGGAAGTRGCGTAGRWLLGCFTGSAVGLQVYIAASSNLLSRGSVFNYSSTFVVV